MKVKKFHRVIIVNEFDEWVATSGDCTLQEAVDEYKAETHKADFNYDKEKSYTAWGIGSDEDVLEF